MKINTKIRYGLRMLVLLAEREKVVNTAELGKKMRVSPKYLRKLAGALERHQLIRSVQGIYGGYILNKKPKDITIATVFNAFEENITLTGCLGNKSCPLNKECLTRPVWQHLENLIQKEFYRISLEEILKKKFNVNDD
jgi:Rrf2 family protein